jgi:hypothetical protein
MNLESNWDWETCPWYQLFKREGRPTQQNKDNFRKSKGSYWISIEGKEKMDAEIIILSNVHRTCSYTCEALSKRLRASCKHHLKALKYIFHKSYLMQEFWIFCWINIWISSGMCDDSAYHITTCLAKTINNIKYVLTFKKLYYSLYILTSMISTFRMFSNRTFSICSI